MKKIAIIGLLIVVILIAETHQAPEDKTKRDTCTATFANEKFKYRDGKQVGCVDGYNWWEDCCTMCCRNACGDQRCCNKIFNTNCWS